MNRVATHLRIVTRAALGLALIAVAVAPGRSLAAGGTVTFASDPTWEVSDANDTIGPDLELPGMAQAICLNAGAPPSCPADAVLLGYGGSAWNADLTSIPGAIWIWAPGIAGETSPSDEDTYDFTKTIVVPGVPTSGTISVGVDDAASIFVNDVSAADVSGFGALTTLDITALLVEGPNEIVVRASNALYCNATCPYQTNPGGVVFGGSIAYGDPTTAATPLPPPVPSAASQPSTSALVSSPPTPTPTQDLAPATGSAEDGISPALLALAALVAGGLVALLVFARRGGQRRSST
jgi:hypothetical protein